MKTLVWKRNLYQVPSGLRQDSVRDNGLSSSYDKKSTVSILVQLFLHKRGST